MPDFELIGWRQQPLDGDIARVMRRSIRMYRRERGRGGHRFSYLNLKSLWVTDDLAHVVLNHKDDLVWQFWWNDPLEGWLQISFHSTRREAQAAAELPRIPVVVPAEKLVPGLYVLAAWPKQDQSPDYKMRVHCRSESAVEAVVEVFDKLGCITKQETVTV